jgi:hypothetical protein
MTLGNAAAARVRLIISGAAIGDTRPNPTRPRWPRATGPRRTRLVCIRRIHAQLIRDTEREIDKQYLDSDGMTGIRFAARSPAADPRPL